MGTNRFALKNKFQIYGQIIHLTNTPEEFDNRHVQNYGIG
jgi:hypothetical protein